MKKINLILKILFFYAAITFSVDAAKSNFFDKGKILFNKKEYDKSKIFFEKDIVFNPKSERSYLYLAKIFNQNENDEQEEINLNNVLLLNPKNDEALYMLTLLKIKQSNYTKAKELIKTFTLVCKDFCSKKEIMQQKFDKLIPENEKNNN
tara:strand:+ start:1422 stop:1871 length:450 start_codon:yes stop_codon:yes gene_type:complete